MTKAFSKTVYEPGGTMISIAIMGYGVVGSGVAEICRINGDLIKKRTGQEILSKKLKEYPYN